MRTCPRRGDHHPLEAQVATTGGSIDMSSVASIEADPRRWKGARRPASLIQFMLVLDITVVNVALPHIDNDLHFSATGLAWVVDGYVLMAGGLLLLGGRLVDILGRRKIFLIGVLLFVIAAATCGVVVNPGMLVVSRLCRAWVRRLAVPASLGLIAAAVRGPAGADQALGLWGGIAGLGGTLGVVISGVLVNYISWRSGSSTSTCRSWCSRAADGAAPGVGVEDGAREPAAGLRRCDHRDGGADGLVYGPLQAADYPWGSTAVLLPLSLGGPVLLGVAATSRPGPITR